MKILWNREALELIPLNEEIIKVVEERVTRISWEVFEKLGEYEETGDSILLTDEETFERDGLVVKLVKRNGKPVIVAGTYTCNHIEEYYVAELVWEGATSG